MLTQLFLAAQELEERPLPYVASLINLGINEIAGKLDDVSPEPGANVSWCQVQTRKRL